jgi:hypothetical protein
VHFFKPTLVSEGSPMPEYPWFFDGAPDQPTARGLALITYIQWLGSWQESYPYYEELIAVAKQYTNAYVDMCWSWIINPLAAKDFLKKYLVTAPANKILTFGGDYLYVEPVLGHAVLARQGIALALSELVEERWLSLDDALELIDPIMHGNARRIFHLEEKQKLLDTVRW